MGLDNITPFSTTSRLTRPFAPGSHALTLLCFAMAAMLLWSTAPRGDVAGASSASIAQPAVLDLSAPLVEHPASRRFSGERPGGLPGGLPGELPGAGTRRIADLRPGHRVLALIPDLDAVRTQQPTAVDPPRYRLVSMRIEHRLDDGSVDDVNIQTLQPAQHHVERYRTAPVPLDLEELGVHGQGVVTLIEPCPPIEPGPGAVVLTTVNHLSDAVYELTVKDPAGRTETLTPTANQPFYCLDESDWLPTEDLLEGDRLRTHTSEVTVVGVEPLPGRHRVYNLTIETEHAYHVSALGVVSHNVCQLPRNPDGTFARGAGGESKLAEIGRKAHVHYQNSLGKGYRFERPLPSGHRVDAINYDLRIVRELKPANARAIREGKRQVAKYVKELEAMTGRKWTGIVDTYNQ